MTVVVLLGAPGAGKGTQAEILRKRLNIPHVATGDLFRAAVGEGSAIGLEARRYMEHGQLVPDEITIRMVLERLGRPDAAGDRFLQQGRGALHVAVHGRLGGGTGEDLAQECSANGRVGHGLADLGLQVEHRVPEVHGATIERHSAIGEAQ